MAIVTGKFFFTSYRHFFLKSHLHPTMAESPTVKCIHRVAKVKNRISIKEEKDDSGLSAVAAAQKPWNR